MDSGILKLKEEFDKYVEIEGNSSRSSMVNGIEFLPKNPRPLEIVHRLNLLSAAFNLINFKLNMLMKTKK